MQFLYKTNIYLSNFFLHKRNDRGTDRQYELKQNDNDIGMVTFMSSIYKGSFKQNILNTPN